MSNKELFIKDVAKVTNGKSDVKNAVENGDYVFFDRSTINKRSNKYLFDNEAIIIPGEDSREIFEPRYFKGKFDLHQRCYAIYDFKNDFYPKYLFYKLKTLTKHFSNVFVGSTVPSLRLDHITDLKISFPDFGKQKTIATILFSLDLKIENNNNITKELESMAKTLYSYWFEQFDFPDKSGKPYKTNGGIMLYCDELKKEIPEGWNIRRIGDIFEVKRGRNITRKTIQNGGIPVIAAGLEPSCYHNVANTTAPVITISGSGANAGFTQLHNQDVWASDCSYVDILTTKYVYIIYLFLKNRQKEIYDMQKGSAQPHVYPQDIMNLEIVSDSSFKIFDDFLEVIKPQFELISKLKQENQKLSELRDWLLPMLMNGQVTVK